ncbi:unnamed protein product [Symbiodinium microadriaticum]|nr:unnamed protein product [Symbiodinium microadriaticum]
MKREWNTKTSVGLSKIIQAAFTASYSVQEMDKKSRSYGFTYFETRAECHLKTAKLPAPFVKYDFTSDFEAAVKAIPTDASTQWVIDNFIGNFGTPGGLMGKRSWMSKQSFDSLKEKAHQMGFSLDIALVFCRSPQLRRPHHQRRCHDSFPGSDTVGKKLELLYWLQHLRAGRRGEVG